MGAFRFSLSADTKLIFLLLLPYVKHVFPPVSLYSCTLRDCINWINSGEQRGTSDLILALERDFPSEKTNVVNTYQHVPQHIGDAVSAVWVLWMLITVELELVTVP